jgi:hypothetical protein
MKLARKEGRERMMEQEQNYNYCFSSIKFTISHPHHCAGVRTGSAKRDQLSFQYIFKFSSREVGSTMLSTLSPVVFPSETSIALNTSFEISHFISLHSSLKNSSSHLFTHTQYQFLSNFEEEHGKGIKLTYSSSRIN